MKRPVVGGGARARGGRSMAEGLLIVGILTFFALPFAQLMTLETSPLLDSEAQQRAAHWARDLLAESLARPLPDPLPSPSFVPLNVAREDETAYEGQVEISPHPQVDGLFRVKAIVRWGWLPFGGKRVVLETFRCREGG